MAIGNIKTELHETEHRLLTELRTLRRGMRGRGGTSACAAHRRAEDRRRRRRDHGLVALHHHPVDILLLWIVLNVTAYIQHWDPYPFILLNLALSFQAAYAAPFIMMSQNRQQDIDRKQAENDYQINVKAELEIELLHQKIDELREKEVLR